MNEASWLSSEEPMMMLAWLTGGAGNGQPVARPSDARPLASPRKLRLFACACALLLPRRTLGLRRSVEAALAFADGDIGEYEMDAARWHAGTGGWTVCHPDAGEAAYYVIRDDSLTDRGAEMAALLRDVFGSPFRPARLPAEIARCGRCGCDRCTHDSGECRCDECGSDAWVWTGSWLTPTALSVARRAYDCHDFAALSVLADALQEAGCEEESLLMHLRGRERCWWCNDGKVQGAEGPMGETEWLDCECRETGGWVPLRGPHVRGCAALDLVLGKS